MSPNPYGPDVTRRFMKKVKVTPGCWVWQATIDRYGYGQISVLGKTRKAHRIAYEMFVGEIPRELLLDHKCRNRWCVNPDHLEPVTNQENTRRGRRKYQS